MPAWALMLGKPRKRLSPMSPERLVKALASRTALAAMIAASTPACDPHIVDAVENACQGALQPIACDAATGMPPSDADLDRAASDVTEAAVLDAILDARGSEPADAEGGLRARLIHRYRFEGSGTDAIDSVGGPSGNGRIINTSLNGGGAVVLAGGRSGQYVELPRFLLHDLTSVTFEAWVTWNGYLDTGGNALRWQRIFDFGQGLSSVPGEQAPPGTTATSYLFLTPRTEPRTAAEVRDGRVQLRVAYQRPNSPQSVDLETQAHHTVALPSGVECHVAVTVDDQTHSMALFLNGNRVAVSPPDMQNVDLRYVYDVNNWLGRSQFAVDDGFAGSISEFRIYAIALTSDQIKASYDAGKDAI
jgi:concanavalin A-like lectin/glucanase superfamily protein